MALFVTTCIDCSSSPVIWMFRIPGKNTGITNQKLIQIILR